MTSEEKKEIIKLSNQGLGYTKIAGTLNLSCNTVKTFLRREKGKEQRFCLQCGKPINTTAAKKEKKFCSDKCRLSWWNEHRTEGNKKAFYVVTCKHCGKEFRAYSTSKRLYCSRGCYADARRKEN